VPVSPGRPPRRVPERPDLDERPQSPTELLSRAEAGDGRALGQVLPIIYDELRHLAHRHLSREPDGHTFATTDLVHEAYLKLIDQRRVAWNDRAHFMAIAATAMRRILVDHARRRQAAKHGGGLQRVQVETAGIATAERAELVLALDDALDRLRDLDARQAKVVECHFFGGMTLDETAVARGGSVQGPRICRRIGNQDRVDVGRLFASSTWPRSAVRPKRGFVASGPFGESRGLPTDERPRRRPLGRGPQCSGLSPGSSVV
jgi:RNA polymerase sigma factor (TIGR02999 family)